MKRETFLLTISTLWVLLLFALGGWWFYLIFLYGDKITQTFGENFLSMIKWEGGTFLFVLFLLSSTLLFLYLSDRKKTSALQAFFASLTHELKTPLASIRLQAEVLGSRLHEKENQDLSERMVEDVERLENQMDKILQLSRLERGAALSLRPISVDAFVRNFAKRRSGEKIKINLNIEDNHPVMADELALELIFRNLVENSKNHGDSDSITITVKDQTVSYTNHTPFKGDEKKAAKLFYKSHASKGSGIGLYIINSLMKKMKGEAQFLFGQEFVIVLNFDKAPTDLVEEE
jgi:signal transduction histidine kinase